MAGGEGTRLRPLTSNQPKPMVPIVGKPCMEHIVELLRAHDFEDVIVTVAFMPQAIRSYFGDGESLGARIEYSVEESPLGTAGSVRLAADKLDDTFLVISGDALCDFDLTQARQVPPQAGSRGHDRAQIRSEPARVRDRRRGRPGPGGALPREALVGAGVLGHDQHGRVRPRAGGAQAHSVRPAFRLLEGALSAAARDGAAHLRAADGRLLGGHRRPRPVPAGEFRRARRARRAHGSRHPAARERLAGGGGGARRPRPGRRARADLELLPHRSRRARRPVLRALGERDPARARTHRPLRDRRVDAHRPRVARRGGDHRTLVRHPRPRPAPGRGRGRRRGQDRRGERAHAGRPRLSEQGGGERRPGPREPHLGVPRVLAPVREGRRGRPRQRRPHARDGLAAGGRVRNRASARRPHRREPGGAGDLPHDRALDDRRNQLDRRGRRRPADASERGGAASSEDARLRRRLPRRLQLRRPGSRADPLLRGSRDPDHAGVPEGDREALLAR